MKRQDRPFGRRGWYSAPGILRGWTALAVASVVLLPGRGHASPLEQLQIAQLDAYAVALESQRRVVALDDETVSLAAEYGQVLRRLEQQRVYNAHLQRLIRDQARERQSLERQLEDFAEVQQGIVPLMISMVDDLEAFIALDVPFLAHERRDRITRLRELLDRADVTDSEKFRQIIDAYQLEAAFGRDIEAYQGQLPGSGQEVDFLRIGRLLLAWQTPDRRETGFWNPQTRDWEELPSRYRSSITQGLRVARAQTAPDLLTLPLTSPQPR